MFATRRRRLRWRFLARLGATIVQGFFSFLHGYLGGVARIIRRLEENVADLLRILSFVHFTRLSCFASGPCKVNRFLAQLSSKFFCNV